MLANLAVVILGVLSITVIACGGAAEPPEGTAVPQTQQGGAIQEVAPTEQGNIPGGTVQVPSTPSESNGASVSSNETLSDQPTGNDDDRVESLVAEWEGDLASTKRVSECVEQALGLKRPLLPEDLQLQANQPAIVTCLKAEVGDD